jgi:hypothetical protein
MQCIQIVAPLPSQVQVRSAMVGSRRCITWSQLPMEDARFRGTVVSAFLTSARVATESCI